MWICLLWIYTYNTLMQHFALKIWKCLLQRLVNSQPCIFHNKPHPANGTRKNTRKTGSATLPTPGKGGGGAHASPSPRDQSWWPTMLFSVPCQFVHALIYWSECYIFILYIYIYIYIVNIYIYIVKIYIYSENI